MQYRTGNPRGGFPQVRGLPDYAYYSQPAGVLSPGDPGMSILPKLATTDTPGVTRRLPALTDWLFPNCSLCAFTHTWYIKICPGFHRTAVLLSGLSPYCCSMPMTHRQGSTWISLTIRRTQSPNTCINSYETLYSLSKTSKCLSQDRRTKLPHQRVTSSLAHTL